MNDSLSALVGFCWVRVSIHKIISLEEGTFTFDEVIEEDTGNSRVPPQ